MGNGDKPVTVTQLDEIAGKIGKVVARRVVKRPVVLLVVAVFTLSGFISVQTLRELKGLNVVVTELGALTQGITRAASDMREITAAFAERVAEAREVARQLLTADVRDQEERDRVEQDAERVLQDPVASSLEKAIADAHLLYVRGEGEAAIEKLRAVANVTEGIDDGLAARAWYRIGSFESVENDWVDATDAYTKTIELQDNYAEAYNNRGIAWAKRGQYATARADFNETIRLRPNDVQGYYNRGFMELGRCEYEAAVADFDVAVRLSPSNAQLYFDRAAAKIGLGHVEGARLDLRIALDHARPQGNRGLVAEIEEQLARLDDGESVRFQDDECGDRLEGTGAGYNRAMPAYHALGRRVMASYG